MDVMFYSLKEAAEKLNKTEEEIREIVRQGKLREFREGPNSLFKVDEIESLMSDTSIMPSKEITAPSAQQPDEEAIPSVPEPAMTQEPSTQPEPTPEPIEIPELMETPEEAEPIATSEPAEIPELMDTFESAMMEESSPTPEPTEEAEPIPTSEPAEIPELMDTFESALAHDSSVTPEPSETSSLENDLTGADTAIAGEGFDVLEETDTGAKAKEDTVIEAKDTTAETPLQEIEEDVNLDSFGSGSGLLDLSLQADDTSLGGILDEIYAPEAGEGEHAEEAGSAVELSAEAEQIMPGGTFAGTGTTSGVPVMARTYAEPEPDTVSNALGIMLFLPLLAIIYTAVVTVTDFGDIMPSIREKVQGIIWYIAVGTVVLALLIVGAAYMLGGKAATTTADKKKKTKKEKKAKEAPPPAEEEATA
jgi:large-conductance mechanosensitive channel